ncbi:polysaccharide biosynthesis C-terminal domain-containing protein [Marinoscillum sp.]|uniref:oligosaccharide flippase family protein n=1 Tax=Marinoscillum sp. TaxID=2024838 RepID=UPI003BAA4509
MSQLRQLAGQTVIYGASSVLGRVLNYLLVPLYTSVFAPEEYGVVTELYAFVAFLNILYTYGFETTYFRFATKSESGKDYFQIAQTSLLITSLLFSSTLIVSSTWIVNALHYPGKETYIVWLAIILAIDAIVAVPFAQLRLAGRSLMFAGLKLGNILVNIGLNCFFLLFCPWWLASHPESIVAGVYSESLGVGYVFLCNLIANGLYLLFLPKSVFNISPSLGTEWKHMLKYALPLMLMGFAGVTNEMLSRAMLKYLLPEGFYAGFNNQQILGIFGACYKLSVFMTLAVQAFRYAFEPFFFSRSVDKNSPQLFATVMHAFVVFGVLSWMIISLFLPLIAPIFLRDPTYLTGLEIVPWLLAGGLLLGIYFNLSVWFKLTDQTKYGAWISVGGAAVTVLGNVALIPLIGYMGSAITTVLSYLFMVIVSYRLGQKHFYIPYSTGKSLFYLLFGALSIGAVYIYDLDQMLRYLLASGLVALFLFLVWLLDYRKGAFKVGR